MRTRWDLPWSALIAVLLPLGGLGTLMKVRTRARQRDGEARTPKTGTPRAPTRLAGRGEIDAGGETSGARLPVTLLWRPPRQLLLIGWHGLGLSAGHADPAAALHARLVQRDA